MPTIKKEQLIMLKSIWDKFSRGDHLTYCDLEELIQSAEEGLKYLCARGEYLSASKTAIDLSSLKSYLFERKNFNKLS